MNLAILILGTIIIVSILGLAGGVLLLWREKIAKKLTFYLVSFAAGALIGIVFTDLLPEALEDGGDTEKILLVAFGGFLLFYIVEKLISLFHCHHADCEQTTPRYLIVMGDFVHNLIDGMLIAVTFMVDIRLGVIASVGVLLHELPQEIGDFGVLLYTGLSRTKAILYNLFSAVGALIGGILVLVFGSSVQEFSPWLIAIVAGNFLYISAVDLIPSTHHHGKLTWKHQISHIIFFVLGAVLLWFISESLHAH